MKTVIASLLVIALPALAEDKLIVAAASSSGTYHTMLSEIVEFCSADGGDLRIEESPVKGGATDNLYALANNRVSAAFLHSDVVYAMAQAEPKYRELKTLVALYPEEIHVLALRNSKTVVKGKNVWNKDKVVEFDDLGKLRDHRVGAAGGGCITARVLTGQGEGHFDVTCFDTGKEVLPALQSGEIDAAIFVGGSPLPNVEALSSAEFKLLPIPEAMASKVSGVYKTATIDYRNLKSGPVKTLAPEAIILTRKYTRPQMIAPQAKFRRCFLDHLDDLKETPGKHPKWQLVDASNHGVWEWYELPNSPANQPIREPQQERKRKR